jgi:VWFA-related protein
MQRPPEPPASLEASGKKVGQITLDVTVTDSSGQPVSGLTEGDFTVLDNHQAAKIVSFRPVNRADGGAGDGATTTGPAEAILLIDEVNNSFESVATERDQIVKYLNRNGGHLPVPISIALFSESGVKIDQPTQDGSVLIAELEKMPIPIHTINSAMGGEGAVERFQLSLKTLSHLLTFTGRRPGRKLLLWIGPGWPMMSGVRFGSTPGDRHEDWDSIVSFSKDLRQARTTLYSINSLSSETGLPHDLYYKNFLKPATSVKDADSANLALPVLALQSGGRVLNGSNDLASEIASCMADAGAYYTIAIQVSPSEMVNDYHSLEVKLAKTGLTARTSAGYYNQPYLEQPPAESQTLTAAATLRTEVRLVVVDAVVLDKKGAPVTGLKAGDFQLKEDGVAQKLASVEEHLGAEGRPVATESAAQAPGSSTVAGGTISASNKPINAPATWNVLLVDQFNTAAADQASMLRQLKQFVKQLPADEPVALAVMSSQVKVLIPFADGAGGISKFLDKNGLSARSSSEPADILAPQEELMIQPNATMQANQARTDVERQGQHAKKTLDGFLTLAKWLSGYPGRKNVYWLTGGFPLQGQPFGVLGYTQATPTGPGNQGGQASPMQGDTDKELQSARVAIYPIDARGIAPPEIAGETTADTQGNLLSIGAAGDQSINVTQDDQQRAAQKSEMLEIAKATGGVASFNNDLAKTLRNDFDRSQSYYTISYTPANTEWKGGYRRIQLSLDEPGNQLIYREGYYAKDPQSAPTPTKEEFRQALGRGAPTATDVLFSAKVNKSADLANVEYTIDPRTIDYQADASGQLVASADCAIVEYDAKGKQIATSLVRVTSTVSPERRAALNVDGLRAKQSIPLKPGAASVVLGVRDQSTGRFGNLEVGLAGQ